MRSAPSLLSLLFALLALRCQAYSIIKRAYLDSGYLPSRTAKPDFISPEALSQKHHISMVQREIIRMPTQTPMVPWKAPGADIAQFIDLYSAMYRDRTMLISNFIDDDAANNIISILLYLRDQDPRAGISLYFNVPGAVLRPALAIYDLLEVITKQDCELETVNLALCAGMGAVLCGAGTKGKRNSMPNARFLLQRTGLDRPIQGQAKDIALEVQNLKKWNDKFETELSKITGQSVERIQQDLQRDFYLSSDEAVQYGLIDRVLLPSPRKRAAVGQDADLGAFEGDDEQKYQGQENEGGWGSRQEQQKPEEKKDDDDDEPKIMKG